jgi:hypothetical protein
VHQPRKWPNNLLRSTPSKCHSLYSHGPAPHPAYGGFGLGWAGSSGNNKQTGPPGQVKKAPRPSSIPSPKAAAARRPLQRLVLCQHAHRQAPAPPPTIQTQVLSPSPPVSARVLPVVAARPQPTGIPKVVSLGEEMTRLRTRRCKEHKT